MRRIRLRFVRHRRALRYVLRLTEDGSARVTIPRGGSIAHARQFAEKNANWLEKQLVRQLTHSPRNKSWNAGTEILFRGERVRLELQAENGIQVARFGNE